MSKTATSKARWATVGFGDVVRLSTERSGDPESDGFERFVGLEHIEPGDLRIRRWGDIADGTTFTSVFRPGQVLFGKRRAYQRKVAVADFGGVCSGDIYVLEPKGKHLLPELLPFICQTDAFFEHAIGTSAGSLSPRTNWTSLSGFEFALPPIEEQRRIAEVLQAAERLRSGRRYCSESLKSLQASFITSQVLKSQSTGPSRESPLGRIPHNWNVVELREVAEFANGVAKPASAFGSGAPFVNLNDVFDSVLLDRVPEERVQVSDTELKSLSLRRNDILFVRSSVKPEGVAKTVLINDDFQGVVFSGFLIRCRVSDPSLDPRFANLLFREQHFRHLALARSTVSLNTNINQQQLGALPVVIPPLAEQVAIVFHYYEILNAQASIEVRAEQDRILSRQILNHFLSDAEAPA